MDFKQNKPTAADCQAARRRSQALFDKVARRHAEGEYFVPERLRLLRLLQIAMGKKRFEAPALLDEALNDNDPSAENLVVGHVADLMVLA